MTEIRVALVDDEPLIRFGFTLMLDSEDGMTVVGEAADGAQAIDLVASTKPDVVLMDIRMPVLNGLDATREIVARYPDARVIVLTTFDLDEYAYAALRGGASGFLLKNSTPPELAAAIRAVARGDAAVAPRLTRRLLDAFVATPDTAAVESVLLIDLTERETEVLRHLAFGQSNAEIAEDLRLAPTTVKTHVSRIITKLEVRDRLQAVICAYDAGLVRPGEPRE